MSFSRLLTRGIKSQRPKGSKTALEHKLPSAGSGQFPKDHQRTDEEETTPPESRGKKRKRGEDTETEVIKLPDQLNFFAGAANSQNQPFLDEESWVHPLAEPSLSEQDRIENVAAEDLDEASCKQILKRNKLKVTLLDDGGGGSGDTKFSEADSSGVKSKKNSKVQVQLIPRPLVSFEELRSRYRISRRLAENLQAQGYKQPTEVQLGSLPILLGSDHDRGLSSASSGATRKHSDIDLLTVAPTGSGKTLAFLVHLIYGLIEDRHARKNDSFAEHPPGIQALVVTPTHELADQIVNEGKKLASGTGISISALRRGTCLHHELLNVRSDDKHPEDSMNDDEGETDKPLIHKTLVKSSILVSTPPLLLSAITHPISSEPLPLPHIPYLILDEADLLLSPPFQPTTLDIWSALPCPNLQTSLWSATIGSSIESLTHDFIVRRRQEFALSHQNHSHHLIRLVVGLKDTAVSNVSHNLTYAATEQGKLLALRQLLNPSHKITATSNSPALRPPFLIFTQTIPRAIALHGELKYDIPPEAGGSSRIAVLHSDLSSLLRSEIMAGFRKGEIWILITTDLLSRGVDFRGLNGVINYDIPVSSASYVHRAGRTGRQGREGGVCVTLYTKEDIPYVKNVANVIVASEKARAKITAVSGDGNGNGNGKDGGGSGGGSSVHQWLLDALPSVSKNTRKQLKKRGVESRRKGFEEREGRKSRISTKSGYERRMEQRRRGVAGRSQKRKGNAGSNPRDGERAEEEGEWGGFED